MVEAALASGQARIYLVPPDLDEIKLVQDRVMGKTPTFMEIALQSRVEQIHADHALLARIIQENVPAEYLAPVRTE